MMELVSDCQTKEYPKKPRLQVQGPVNALSQLNTRHSPDDTQAVLNTHTAKKIDRS